MDGWQHINHAIRCAFSFFFFFFFLPSLGQEMKGGLHRISQFEILALSQPRSEKKEKKKKAHLMINCGPKSACFLCAPTRQ